MADKNKDKDAHTLRKDLAADPTDFSKDGECSRCGGCCASILPASLLELDILKRWALERGLDPKIPDGDNIVYMHCPFLENRPDGRTACLAYDVRPAVCRSFSCHNTNMGNAQAWLDQEGEKLLPQPENIWRVFNRTGIRLDGTEIPFDKAPLCQVGTADGGEYRFQIGRPASFLLASGRYVPPGIVVGLFRNGIQMFDNAVHQVVFVPFDSMAEVMSESCILKKPEEEKKEDTEGGEADA